MPAERQIPHVDPLNTMLAACIRRMTDLRWLLLVLLAVIVACEPSKPPMLEKRADAIRSIAGSIVVVPRERIPNKKRRFKDAIVYVDGEPKGVMRLGELPPQLRPAPVQLNDGRWVNRFLLMDYFELLEVPLDRIKAAYFHGGRNRTVTVAGDGLRKFRYELRFSFTGGTFGKPRVHWLSGRLKVNTTIDKINAVSVFVEKDPPPYERATHSFTMPDGTKTKGIPFVPEESFVKGTRLHVDGKLTGAVKRKKLPDELLAPDSSALQPRFLLGKFLDSIDIPHKDLKTMDFAQGDRFVARLDAEEWRALEPTLSFSIPRRSQGKILLHFPEDLRMKAWPDDPALLRPTSARISSISIFHNVPAPDRTLVQTKENNSLPGPGSDRPQVEL